MTDGGKSSKKSGDVSSEERRMLDALGSPRRSAAEPDAAPDPETPPSTARFPDVSSGLTLEEELILRRAGEESRRLAQTSLREMFDKGDAPDGSIAGFEALLALTPEPPAPEPSAFERSRFGRALAATLDFANAPFGWLPHAYRLGLGLCGVLLLITLVVVILARVLGS